jgi:hypothetical protein
VHGVEYWMLISGGSFAKSGIFDGIDSNGYLSFGYHNSRVHRNPLCHSFYHLTEANKQLLIKIVNCTIHDAIEYSTIQVPSEYVDPIDHDLIKENDLVYCVTQDGKQFFYRKESLDQWFQASGTRINPLTNLEIKNFYESVKIHKATC